MTSSTPNGLLMPITVTISLALVLVCPHGLAAGEDASEFFVLTATVPKVLVRGFPSIANVVVTNRSAGRLPVKVFDLANGGGFSDFAATFESQDGMVVRFERPPIQAAIGTSGVIDEDPAQYVWLEPGSSIEMWFDINQAIFVENPLAQYYFDQTQPDYPIGESTLSLDFGKSIGVVSAGLVEVREPTLNEQRFLDSAKVQTGEDRIFVRTLVLDIEQFPPLPDLPIETDELLSVIMELKACVACVEGAEDPRSRSASPSSPVYSELNKLIQYECSCSWAQNFEKNRTGQVVEESVEILLRKNGGPVSSLRDRLESNEE